MLAQSEKQRQEQVGHPMQSAIETASAQHVRNVTMFTQILSRQTEVPFEIQHCNDGGRHYIRIRRLTLSIFRMLQRFQHVITQTKTTAICVSVSFSFTVVVGIHQRYRKLMDFPFPATLGSDLG